MMVPPGLRGVRVADIGKLGPMGMGEGRVQALWSRHWRGGTAAGHLGPGLIVGDKRFIDSGGSTSCGVPRG